jgi:hypothetical protein
MKLLLALSWLSVWGFGLVSCRDTLAPKSDSGWSRLDLYSDHFEKISVTDSTLVVSTGVFGVYQQTPSYAGGWSFKGLAFLDRQFIDYKMGVRSATCVSGGGLLAGIHPGLEDTATVYLLDPRDGTWKPRSQGLLRRTVYDLEEVEPGNYVAATSDGVFRTSDEGAHWLRVFAMTSALGATLFQAGDRIYGGGQTLNENPFLIMSADGGRQWRGITLTGVTLHGGPEQVVLSIAADEADSSALFIATDRYAFRREGASGAFVPIRKSDRFGTIHVDPGDAKHLVVSAESVSVSTDQGNTWKSVPFPGALIGRGTVDWNHNRLLVPILESDGGMLYSYELP